MKTIEIYYAFQQLNAAKLTKMESKDKFAVIKALRELKAIAKEYEDIQKDAVDKLKGDNHDALAERYQLIVNRQTKDLTLEEVKEAVEYMQKFNRELEDCLSPDAMKERELAFPALTEDAVQDLLDSNDWEARIALLITDLLTKTA